MKKFFILSLLLFTSTCAVFAASHRPCPGEWDVRGEVLFFTPSISQSFFAQETLPEAPSFPGNTREDNGFNQKYAYRLYATYAFCDTDLQLIWTHFPRQSHSEIVSGRGPLLPTSGMPVGGIIDIATSTVQLNYYAVEALIGFWERQCNNFDFMFRTGLQYANIKFYENILYLGPTRPVEGDRIENISHCWGIGPEVVFETNYNLHFFQKWCPGDFGLASTVKGGLLVSKYNTQLIRTIEQLFDPFSNDEARWDIVPMFDLRLGLNYYRKFRCFNASFEIGYEVLSYINAIDRIFFVDVITGGLSTDLYSNANFHGPYLALDFTF